MLKYSKNLGKILKNSYIILGSIFIFSLYWFAYLYKPFWSVIAVAMLLTIATHSLNTKIIRILKNEVLVSTILTILLSILFFVPILYSIISLTKLTTTIDTTPLKSFLEYLKTTNFHFQNDLAFINDIGKDFMANIDFATIGKKIFTSISSFTTTGFGFFFEMLIILTFFFFGNLYANELINFVKKVIPVEESYTNYVFIEVTNVMSVVFYSILITAMFEGTLFAMLGLYFGYDAILLGILYGFASLIPVIGGIIMWLPLALYELSQGNITNAIIITLYSIIVISIIADTFIKPMIITFINKKFLKTPAKINELIIFFSIVAGISTFGFWGMILGPAITTFFISLLQASKELSIQDPKLNQS